MSSLLWTTTWSLQRLPWWRKEWKRFLIKATTERNWGRRLFSWSLIIACVRPLLCCAPRSLRKRCSKGLDSKEVDDASAYPWCVFPCYTLVLRTIPSTPALTVERCRLLCLLISDAPLRVMYSTPHSSFNCWVLQAVSGFNTHFSDLIFFVLRRLGLVLVKWSLFILIFNLENSKTGSVCFNAEADRHGDQQYYWHSSPGGMNWCAWKARKPR